MKVAVVVGFLLVLLLLKKCASCPSFTSSVEEGRAVCPGEELTYTCTIDDTDSFATVWRMTPEPDTCAGGVAVLLHSTLGDPPIECGNFSAQLTANDSNCYTSTLTVTASLELNGTVVRCEENSGNTVGTATIMTAQVTGDDLDLEVQATYEDSKLVQLGSSWNAICSPITDYNITIVCGTFTNISLVLFADCPGGTSGSVVNDIDATGDCKVSLSVGELSQQKYVSQNNDYVTVNIADDASPTNVTYSFQREEACLQIEFSYSGIVNKTVASSVCGDSTKPLQVFIPPETNYGYVASTVECGACEPELSVIVLGSGTTGSYEFESCDATFLLGRNISYQDCFCNAGYVGCVTYGTLLPGSIAAYDCCDGYELQGDGVLRCQPDGMWNGDPPTCEPVGSTEPSTLAIAFISVAAILFLTTIIFMLLFIVCCLKALSQGKVSGGQRLGSPSEMKSL